MNHDRIDMSHLVMGKIQGLQGRVAEDTVFDVSHVIAAQYENL
jgi:hypothetical protein